MNVPVMLMPAAGDEIFLAQPGVARIESRFFLGSDAAWLVDNQAETLRITGECAAVVRYEIVASVPSIRVLQCPEQMMVLAFVLNRSLQWQSAPGITFQLLKRRCYALSLGNGKRYIIRLSPGVSRIAMLYCTADYAAELASELPRLKNSGFSRQHGTRPVPSDGAEINAGLWQRVMDLQNEPSEGPAREAHMHAQVLQVFSEFINAVHLTYAGADAANIPVATLEKVLSAKKMIDENRLPERLSVPAVAKEAGLTIRQLQESFRLLFGTTMDKYQREVKLHKAAAMLVSNAHLSVYQVGLKNGFNDESSFARSFKRVLGVTPSQYRRLNN